jgi:hypothetical protein
MKIYFKKFLKLIWPFVFKIKKLIHPLLIFKYELRLNRNYTNKIEVSQLSGIILILDEKFQHGGLVDKMKGIVSGYYLSIISKNNFSIYFSNTQNPLLTILSKSINIITEHDKLSFSKFNASPILWYNYVPKSKKYILWRLKYKMQVHLYCNVNILPVFSNNISEMAELWSKNFNEIFTFDINSLINYDFNKYQIIGVHLRFMDTFGDFKDLKASSYTQDYRLSCINWCIDTLLKLFSDFPNYKFLIVSDSKYFLDCCKDLPVISSQKERFIIDSDLIGHIHLINEFEIFKKAVSDFVSLSLCNKVFQIRYGFMHNSDFSRYASYINLSDFELIEFNNS